MRSVAALRANALAIEPEQPGPARPAHAISTTSAVSDSEAINVRRAPEADGHDGDERVALAIAKRVVHRGREEWEAEPGNRAQERHRCECCNARLVFNAERT